MTTPRTDAPSLWRRLLPRPSLRAAAVGMALLAVFMYVSIMLKIIHFGP